MNTIRQGQSDPPFFIWNFCNTTIKNTFSFPFNSNPFAFFPDPKYGNRAFTTFLICCSADKVTGVEAAPAVEVVGGVEAESSILSHLLQTLVWMHSWLPQGLYLGS